MPQDTGKILPQFINTDKSFDNIGQDESPFMKGVTWDINGNPGSDIGTANPSGEGQNMFALTPVRSNEKVKGIDLPEGYNKSCGTFESRLTQELYHFNFNSLGNHGIYVIDGNSGEYKKVIIDPELAFSDSQDATKTSRVLLRYVKDKDGIIFEKHLLWTDGNKWHGWINVIAAIETNGFDVSLYPYWTVLPPHFDRRELLEWAVRPPMVKPVVSVIQSTPNDTGINRIVDKNFRFAYSFYNTDGRLSTASPYSLPLQVKSQLYNTSNVSKKALLKFNAGSPLTEKINIYVQQADDNALESTAVYGDWKLYDTIDKFSVSPGGDYWNRTNQWGSFNYDPVFNTIEYEFDNSKVGRIVAQEEVNRLFTGMPQLSKAVTDIDDAVLLCNNRYGYDNLSKTALSELSAIVKEKELSVCSRPLRTVYLYAYIGQCYPEYEFAYTSQVGYTYGTDKQVRFGGLRIGIGQTTQNPPGAASVNIDESKFFGLDFADKNALRVYLKGTPYFADGEWCIVKTDNSITPIGEIYDFNNVDVRTNVQNIFKDGSYFICRFKLTIPAGRYIAAIGRHNVSSQGDYRGESSYVYGIANSRAKTTAQFPSFSMTYLPPSAIDANSAEYGYSKEMMIDCVSSDIDVWGNNHDTFYIFCPYNQNIGGNGKYRFIEGYLKESSGASNIAVEMFPYFSSLNNFDDWGKNTDKNGFYWGFTKAAASEQTDIQFRAKVNCIPKTFNIGTSESGSGWKKNAVAYLASNNGGVVGDCNRILYKGKITSFTGIGYSNIGISIKDGPTVYTGAYGEFTAVVHNGTSNYRNSTVCINSGGNFIITLQNCGQIPLSYFDESLVPCTDCATRSTEYPLRLNIQVEIQDNYAVSLKEGGKYSIGCAVADLAGRMTFVNNIQELEVSTFLQRDNINATYFQMLVSSALNIAAENKDFKWFSPYVSKNVINKRSVQWVGDKLVYLDNNGNVVSDPVAATFVKIVIDSLFDANVLSNFSLLSKYQFVKGDRVRILDNGEGVLFNIATYGDPIDVQVFGTNYNQAAINAGLLTSQENTIIDAANTVPEQVGLIVAYDQRFEKLDKKTGFWIEIYTPTQSNDVIPFFEVSGFYPIINGAISEFTGYSNGIPAYNQLTSINIDFWDTYYIDRSIAGKYFTHPFCSPNVTDNWGANITSGGRINIENKEAKQEWFGGDVIRSGRFFNNNGLATFKEINRKDYGIYPFGEIMAAHTKRNIVAFNCTNDWFVAEFNMPYTKMSKGGQLVVTNLDENLSLPRQKGGPMYGIEKTDLETLVIDEDFYFWYDRKNTSFVKCNYQDAVDVSQQLGEERGGIQSYLNAKTYFINNFNNSINGNPYNIRYTVEPYGVGQLLFTFYWDSVPAGIMAATISYSDNNGVTWNGQTGAFTSPRTVILNNAQWIFMVGFQVQGNQNYVYDFKPKNNEVFDVVAGIDGERGNVYLTFRPRRNNTNNKLSYVNNRRNLDLKHQETFVYSIQYKGWLPCVNFTPESYARLRGRWANVEFFAFAAGVPYIHNNTENNSYLNYFGVQCEPVIFCSLNKEKDAVKIFGSVAVDVNGSSLFVDMIFDTQTNSFSYIPANRWVEREKMLYAELLRNMVSYPPISADELFRSMLFDGKRIFGSYAVARFVQKYADLGKYFQLTAIDYLFTSSHPTKP